MNALLQRLSTCIKAGTIEAKLLKFIRTIARKSYRFFAGMREETDFLGFIDMQAAIRMHATFLLMQHSMLKTEIRF